MEVHHHPKVEKKNFKEYFLEFIMIFLAVTSRKPGKKNKRISFNINKEYGNRNAAMIK